MSSNWEEILLKGINRNSDKIDELKIQFDDKLDNFEEKIEHKLEESSDQHQNLITAQEIATIEHKRMNDLLDVHIKGVESNKERLNNFEYRVEPLLNKLEPVIIDFEKRQNIKEYKKNTHKQMAIKLTIISISVGIISGILKLFGVY